VPSFLFMARPKGIPAWNKGKKMGFTPIFSFKKGRVPWNKGKKLSTEVVQKLRDAKLGKSGKLSNAWKGGKTPRNKHYLSRPEYKNWRNKVFERDDYTCQECGERGVFLEAHHKKSWAKYPELRFVVDNGVTLCRDCHIEVDILRARFYKK
jgi:hypothetical protein